MPDATQTSASRLRQSAPPRSRSTYRRSARPPAAGKSAADCRAFLRISCRPFLLLLEFRERFSQLRPRRRKTAFAGSFWNTEHFGDLSVRITFDVVHDQSRSVNFGKIF